MISFPIFSVRRRSWIKLAPLEISNPVNTVPTYGTRKGMPKSWKISALVPNAIRMPTRIAPALSQSKSPFLQMSFMVSQTLSAMAAMKIIPTSFNRPTPSEFMPQICARFVQVYKIKMKDSIATSPYCCKITEDALVAADSQHGFGGMSFCSIIIYMPCFLCIQPEFMESNERKEFVNDVRE